MIKLSIWDCIIGVIYSSVMVYSIVTIARIF